MKKMELYCYTTEILATLSDMSLLLAGDFNAITGSLLDYLVMDQHDPVNYFDRYEKDHFCIER